MSAPTGGNRRATHPPVRKSLGQHFLADPRILARIADALELAPDETVIEVGPGRGALTDQLATRARRVIAIELDRALAAGLAERYADRPGIEILHADVLDVDLGAVAAGPYALVGNVPYYITTPILFHSLRRPRPTRAVFLVQREVADRLAAQPGTKEYGALTVNVRAVAQARSLFRVAPGSFQPPPRVDSAVVRLTPRPDPVIAPHREERFRTFVQEAFSLRRKQMRRVLRSIAGVDPRGAETILEQCNVSPEARPETLSAEDFAALVRRLDGEG